MENILKKFLPLGGFIVAFSGGLALHFALAFQLLGLASLKKQTMICYILLEAVFFIISFVSAIILMTRLTTMNNQTEDI